jgi:hypothetical protein
VLPAAAIAASAGGFSLGHPAGNQFRRCGIGAQLALQALVRYSQLHNKVRVVAETVTRIGQLPR